MGLEQTVRSAYDVLINIILEKFEVELIVTICNTNHLLKIVTIRGHVTCNNLKYIIYCIFFTFWVVYHVLATYQFSTFYNSQTELYNWEI